MSHDHHPVDQPCTQCVPVEIYIRVAANMLAHPVLVLYLDRNAAGPQVDAEIAKGLRALANVYDTNGTFEELTSDL